MSDIHSMQNKKSPQIRIKVKHNVLKTWTLRIQGQVDLTAMLASHKCNLDAASKMYFGIIEKYTNCYLTSLQNCRNLNVDFGPQFDIHKSAVRLEFSA